MPEVDILEVEKQVKKKEDETKTIKSKVVGDLTYYQGPYLKEWYDNADECLKANQEHARLEEYKKSGLDEFGRLPEEVAYHKERQSLLKQRNELLDKAKEFDKQISALRIEDFKKKGKK